MKRWVTLGVLALVVVIASPFVLADVQSNSVGWWDLTQSLRDGLTRQRDEIDGLQNMPRLVVVDGSDEFVGYIQETVSSDADYWDQFGGQSLDKFPAALTWVQVDNQYIPLIVTRNFVSGNPSVYFGGANCTGDAYISSNSVFRNQDGKMVDVTDYAVGVDGTVYRAGNIVGPTVASSRLFTGKDQDAGWDKTCSSSSSSNGDQSMAPIGNLPDFQPPFRVVMQ